MSKASCLRSGKTKVGDRIDNTETPEQTECFSCKCDIGHGSGTKVVECEICKKMVLYQVPWNVVNFIC